ERDRAQKRARLLVRLVGAGAALFWRIEAQRRNAHCLSGFQPVLRLRALAVDAHLAFADHALDVGKTQAGKTRLKEAIDPHARFVGGHGDVLYAGITGSLALREQTVAARGGRSALLPVILRRTPQACLE